VQTQVLTMLSVYFNKRRGLANSICNCGISIGGLVFAPIYTALFKTYSFTGTYIFIAGFTLQILIVGALLRPLSFYEKQMTIAKSQVSVPGTVEEPLLNGEKRNGSGADNCVEIELRQNGHVFRQLSRQDNDNALRRRTTSENSQNGVSSSKLSLTNSFLNSDTSKYVGTDLMNNSTLDLTLQAEICHVDTDSVETNGRRTCFLSMGVVIRKVLDLKLLSKPHFLYFLVCNIFLCPGAALANAFWPAHAFEIGIDADRVSMLVSVMSVMDLLSRFAFAYVADKGWCHRSTLIAISMGCIGVTFMFSSFGTTYASIMAFNSIAGFFHGVYFSMSVVVITDILSSSEFKVNIGISLPKSSNAFCLF